MSSLVRVSRPGFDADTTSTEHLVIDDTYGVPFTSTALQGRVDYQFAGEPTPGATITIATIPHGLSYAPAAIVRVQDIDGAYYAAGAYSVLPYSVGSSPPQCQIFEYGTDATNLYIRFFEDNSTGFELYNLLDTKRFRFKYDIFYLNGS